ncbi:unnamed protein product, partial [Linum tenue]
NHIALLTAAFSSLANSPPPPARKSSLLASSSSCEFIPTVEVELPPAITSCRCRLPSPFLIFPPNPSHSFPRWSNCMKGKWRDEEEDDVDAFSILLLDGRKFNGYSKV